MKKTIILGLLVIVLMLSGCGNATNGVVKNALKDIDGQVVTEGDLSKESLNDDVTPAAEEQEVTGDAHSVPEQLKIIAFHSDLWASSADYANDVYNYAITDLDNNGRLELIASNSGGTGSYTYSKFYEINEDYDGLITCEHMSQEGDSQADIPVETASGYYDSQNEIMYYIFDDFLKNGAAEYYENKRAIYLEDGRIKEIPLAYKTTIYTDSTPKTTYKDKDQKEISEEEYDAIADYIFADMEKKKVSLGWCEFSRPDEVRNMSEEELFDLLLKSYEAFSIE